MSIQPWHRRGFNLASETTLGATAVAEELVCVQHPAQLPVARQLARVRGLPLHLIGGGSNVLLAPEIPGLTVLMRTRGLQLRERGNRSLIVAEAGENWHGLVRWSLARGLAGLECLALIPGSVGAAPIQNIGAYGAELSDVLEWVEVFNLHSGRTERLAAADCALSYRDSLFRRAEGAHLIVLRVAIVLAQAAGRIPATDRYPDIARELALLGCRSPSPLQVAEAVVRVRRRKLPDWRRVGNVGSVFKNPTVNTAQLEQLRSSWPMLKASSTERGFRLSAAQLIDLAGLKRERRGAARPWNRQPLVLVLERKPGGADGRDFLELLRHVHQTVSDRYGINLEVEPRPVGRDVL
ncbi:MAG: UDP-N-acetylmuramate dehydrogenase [Pseudomonadota bacterium]